MRDRPARPPRRGRLLPALLLLLPALPGAGQPPATPAAGEPPPPPPIAAPAPAEAPEAAAPDAAAPSWREHYTLGPGDSVHIRFYGRPELDRAGVPIVADGTLSYLQANAFPAAGMTLDDLRRALEREMARHYRHPRLIVTPAELRSKRYVILGKVVDKGVFILDRPLTLLEVIARSRGIETGLFEQATVEIADLDRSFVIREGRRLPVDFARLYYEGDLSQNVPIEPGDYIFLASNLANEFYVLGAVVRPGPQGLTYKASLVSAVTRREGFAANAWRERVLVVRGSLQAPETFVVDVSAILAGRTPDFPLEPGDLVYVHDRPWYEINEILENAVARFLESATAVWVNTNVPDLIRGDLLPPTGWRDSR